MLRLLLAVALSLVLVDPAGAWCQRGAPAHPIHPPVYIPAYPLTPAIWGAPAPQPLPPAPPPIVPKRAGIREDEEPVTPPKPPDKKGPGGDDSKDKETPRIPKLKLPLPGDPVEPPKREPVADASAGVEQFLVPAAASRAEPRPEVKVGFFNHSGRAIDLVVNGETLSLPEDQYISLRLPRTFTWSEKGRKGTEVAVPADADGIEIVFRK